MKWFIIALVYFNNTEEINIHKMTSPSFSTKENCMNYYINEPSVKQDILLLEPNQKGHTLLCLTQQQIDQLDISKIGT
jgi:hypothetical protein